MPTSQEMGFLADPTILVIDDDPEMREFLSFCLESWARVLTADGGATGIAACQQHLPDLVLLDVNMPGLDGFDVINELKHDSTTRHIPVMFITAESLPEVESECLEAGAADYIAKPINSRVLVARARTHVLLKQQSDRLSQLAIIDGLTGAMTRSFFDERLTEEVSRSRRSGQPFTVAIIDGEAMDDYVATYGQLAADDVLASVAGVLRRVARRDSDIVSRYTASRLVMLLLDTDAATAEPLAARVQAMVRDLAIPHRRSAHGIVEVSVSLIDGADGASAEAIRSALS